MNKLLFTTAVVTFAVMGPPLARAAIVIDGDFLTPPGSVLPPGFTDYLSGSTFGPWTVTGTGHNAGVDLIGPFASGGHWKAPVATDGSVDLDGLAPGGIWQTILGLTSGDRYKLTFELSGNPDGPPKTKSVDVSIGSVSDDNFLYTLSPSNKDSNMLWQTETVTFTAGATNTLAFASQDVNSPFGPAIAEVAIVSAGIPESATWAMMVLGLAGLGIAGYRRTRPPVSMTV